MYAGRRASRGMKMNLHLHTWCKNAHKQRGCAGSPVRGNLHRTFTPHPAATAMRMLTTAACSRKSRTTFPKTVPLPGKSYDFFTTEQWMSAVEYWMTVSEQWMTVEGT